MSTATDCPTDRMSRWRKLPAAGPGRSAWFVEIDQPDVEEFERDGVLVRVDARVRESHSFAIVCSGSVEIDRVDALLDTGEYLAFQSSDGRLDEHEREVRHAWSRIEPVLQHALRNGCRGLPPVAPARLHKRSMPGSAKPDARAVSGGTASAVRGAVRMVLKSVRVQPAQGGLAAAHCQAP
jgi:hypothetical protein